MSRFNLYETINEATGEKVTMKRDAKGGDSIMSVLAYTRLRGACQRLWQRSCEDR